LVGTSTTNIPDAGATLTPTIEVSSTTASSVLEIDYMTVISDR
jgi:hypothetical protein